MCPCRRGAISPASQIIEKWQMAKVKSKREVARGWGPHGRPLTGCKRLFFARVAHAGEGEGRINVLPWYRPVSVAKYLPVTGTNAGWKTGLLAKASGRHVVRGRQSSPIPAQQPAVIGGSMGVRQGNRQGW